LKNELENMRKGTENQNIKVRKMYVVLIQKFRKEDFEDLMGFGIKKKEVVFLIDELTEASTELLLRSQRTYSLML